MTPVWFKSSFQVQKQLGLTAAPRAHSSRSCLAAMTDADVGPDPTLFELLGVVDDKILVQKTAFSSRNSFQVQLTAMTGSKVRA